MDKPQDSASFSSSGESMTKPQFIHRRQFIHFCSANYLIHASMQSVYAQFNEPTAYIALDREFAEPLVQQFESEFEIAVRAKYDVESTKTIGLVNLIRSEAMRARADLFWNNEIINTIRLKKLGLLAAYKPRQTRDFPELFYDPDHYWHGFAARARVLIVNTRLVPKEKWPRSIHDMTLPNWRAKIAIAKPFFGTTATHAACLYSTLGTQAADRFFADLHRNEVQVMAGNKPVAEAVASGKAFFGLTDTDDALVMKNQGHPVELIYPDQEPGRSGTLFIPNTLALVKNGPQPEAAKHLIDWLYRPETETVLSQGAGGQIPLSHKALNSGKVESPSTVKPMNPKFENAAELFDDVMKRLAGLFQ